MNRIRTAAVGSVACAAVLAALPAAALAAKHKPAVKPAQTTSGNTGTTQKVKAGYLFGTLQSISSSSATVTGAGSGTAVLTANTRFVAHSYAAATAGLKANDQVAILSRGGNATTVEYDTKSFAFARGTIAGTLALSGTKLTVTPTTGAAVTVATNGQTRYVVSGTSTTTAPAFPANTTGRVLVVRYTDGTNVASVISTGTAAPSTRVHGVVISGTVSATSAGATTLTVTTKSGPVNVTITSATQFRVNGKASPTAPAFTANQKVVVIATQNTNGGYTALVVSTRP